MSSKTIHIFTLFLTINLLPVSLFARNFTSAQVSLVPGFGTHPSGDIEVDYSINILGGKVLAVDKFELGGLFNWETRRLSGFQLCGGINLIEGQVDGVQLSGLANINAERKNGVGISGLLNHSGGGLTGINIAGLVNSSNEEITGIQVAGLLNRSDGDQTGISSSGIGNFIGSRSNGIYIAGIFNFIRESSEGIYIAGIANFSGDNSTGILVSGIMNYSRDLTGIEGGLLNINQNVTGIQFGLVNMARSVEGIPFGLFSYVRDVPLRFDCWASETAALTAAVRSGNEKFYPLIAAGLDPYGDIFHWTVGWGFGREWKLKKKSFFDMDMMLYKVMSEKSDFLDFNQLYKLRLIYGRDLSVRFAVYGGITFNLFASKVENSAAFSIWGPEEETWDNAQKPTEPTDYSSLKSNNEARYYFWPGFVFGIRI